MSEAPQPVLVIAPPGGGAGTVAAALGRNPLAFDVPALNVELESNIYDLVFEMTGIRGIQAHGHLRAMGLLLGGEQSMLSVELARRWMMERMHLPASAIADWIRDRVAPRRLILPVSAGLYGHITRRRLSWIFAQADIVVVRRHPSAFAQAVMDQAGGAAALVLGASGGVEAGPRLPDPVGLWTRTEEAVDALLEMMPDAKRHDVKAEDLAQDPKALGALAGALGLRTDAGSVDAMQSPEASPFYGVGPYGAHSPGDITPLAALTHAPDTPRMSLPKAARALGYT